MLALNFTKTFFRIKKRLDRLNRKKIMPLHRKKVKKSKNCLIDFTEGSSFISENETSCSLRSTCRASCVDSFSYGVLYRRWKEERAGSMNIFYHTKLVQNASKPYLTQYLDLSNKILKNQIVLENHNHHPMKIRAEPSNSENRHKTIASVLF